MPPVVPWDWVSRHPEVALADVRWYLDGRSGRAAYEVGHVPGAVFVDLDRWLAAPGSAAAGRHPLPDPDHFAAGMSALGIGDEDVVAAYDDAGGVVAARLVWLLRVTGHPAALVDGGLDAYPRPLTEDPTVRAPARFTPRPWPADRLVGPADLASAAYVLLDARAPERFRGEHEPVDPVPGHIPGARNVPCRDTLTPDGRLLPAPELRERFAEAGVGEDRTVVAYCGSGVNACHTLLALELAGLGAGRLYPGSWSQYCQSGRPVETGG